MDEQNGGGQQPGSWEAWTASAGQSGPTDPAAPQAATEGQPADPGSPAAPGEPQQEPPEDSAQSAAFTQPIGIPGGGYPGGGYPGGGYPGGGYPGGGYPAGGYPAGGYGLPGYSPTGQGPGGLGTPAQPGEPAYGQPGSSGPPPGSGYGPPGGGYGQPAGGQAYQGGGYGQPPGGGYGGGGYGGGGYGMPPASGPPPRRRRGVATVITYLAVAALAATAGGLVVSLADSGTSQPSASSGSGNNGFNFPSNNSGSGSNSTSGANTATMQRVRRAIMPGLVIINSTLQYDGRGVSAAGTGMIISKSGLVLTNNHVIDGTTALSATVVSTGRMYPAKWLGYDKTSDVAVIQIQGATNLSTVPVGDSSTVKLGDDVIGMGNAGGAGSIETVTGTITGLDQTITASDQGSNAAPERLTDMLQTNANIIPGDSGGPLASTAGKVIGMDTAASTSNFSSSNQQDTGFAIPINRALTIAHQIIAGQASATVQIGPSGFVGVLVAGNSGGGQSTQSSPQAQLQQQEQANGGQIPNGAPSAACVPTGQSLSGVPTSIAPVSAGTLVLGAICGAPAAQAGVISGDVITSVNGRRVTSPSSLTGILQGVRGGSTVPITWVTPNNQTVSRSLVVSYAPPQ